jgi:hypothetical protein
VAARGKNVVGENDNDAIPLVDALVNGEILNNINVSTTVQ